MGLGTSAVRQIAEATSAGNQEMVARTVLAMRRAVLLFGGLVSCLLFLLRGEVSILTFGTDEFSPAIGWLALVPVIGAVAGGQSALLRGVRRMGDLARVTVLGGALGTLAGLPILVLGRGEGIAPYLLTVAASALAASWWYARKVEVLKTTLTVLATLREAREMVMLGGILMLAGLGTIGTGYLVKVLITRILGLPVSGLFEASSQLSNVYVGFILAAMGADFFPHLSSVSQDNPRSSQLINAQAEIGLLLAMPGILAVIALGPYVLQALYSSSFAEAFEILRWQAAGTFLRVVSWPLGFLFLARGSGSLFFLAETGSNLVHLALVYFGIHFFGVQGIGLAFFGTYLFLTAFNSFLAFRLIQFHWSRRNVAYLAGSALLLGVALVVSYAPSPPLAVVAGLVLTVGFAVPCSRRLYGLVGPERLAKRLGPRFARYLPGVRS